MRPTPYALISIVLVALAATESAAEPIFASPPHVVADADGRRIVLFLNEPVSGALTARAGNGYEVRVPRSAVAPAIQGQDYGAEGWGNGGDTVKHLVLAAGPKGDTSIRIEPSAPVGGIDAHSVDDPPRLVIELLATAPTRTPVPTKTPGRSPATARPITTKIPLPAPTATSISEPIAIAEAPSPEALARATVLTAMAPLDRSARAERPAVPAVGELLAAASEQPGAVVPAPLPAAVSATMPHAALTAPPLGTTTSPFGLGCLWRRFGGVAMCVADPKAAPYAGDHTIMAMVGALARGKLPEPEDTPAVATPALAFLTADVLFATRAPEAKLLPVVDAYRQALRRHPDFPEAWRARLNIALAYRAMEFLTEVRTVAGEAALDPTAGLARGIAGDLAFLTGKTAVAMEEYRRAAEFGGMGACLAARGRARLALATGDATTPAAEMSGLGGLCPPELVSDAETVWVRGRLALAQHDLATARTLLGEAQKGLGKYDRGAVIADLGGVGEAAGDAKAARESYDQLLGGAYGARAARLATVRLAILDGVGGDVTAGLKRLERLTPEASDPARRTLVMQSARSALERGAAGAALAALHDAHVDPRELPLEDQLLVARAYREIGLGREAEGVLAAAQAQAGSEAPDALFVERGTLALARRDAAETAAIADEWIRMRGRNGGALGLKARAAGLAGDGIAAHASVAAAVMEDASLTRTLALDVAELLREREPAAALVLAREALDPGPTAPLPAERTAVGLALVGTLAEAAGDDDTALAAFTTLTARYGKEPVAADAAYRAARIAARRVPAGASAAYDEAARSKDPLARRVAGAARDYETIMKPFGGGQEPLAGGGLDPLADGGRAPLAGAGSPQP